MGTNQEKIAYSEEVAAEILGRISEGEPLRRICSVPTMPSRRTVEKWRDSVEGFAERYQRARDQGFDAIAEECFDIADDGTNDYMDSKDGPAFNAENVQRSKLRVHTRLELLKKWDPKRYGDMIKQQHSGSLSLENLVAGSYKGRDAGD